MEVADVIREFLDAQGRAPDLRMNVAQRQVLAALAACRTAQLGGHVERCDNGSCDHERIAYNSCLDRHCPKCQALKQAKWLDARRKDLLPVPYFHVVFTLPQEASKVALQNKRVMYGILIRAASETLKQIARDPKHLGAEIGFMAVLHTWGQTLLHHPHLHCVVPGGGLASDSSRWIECRKNFFLPVQVLSQVFRGKFLDYLRIAYKKGQLRFAGKLEHLTHETEFETWCAELRRKGWVVYAKAPFGGPQQVLKYLARYTHRVAIANSRLVSLKNGKVSFRYKDYARGDAARIMSVDVPEFARRFTLHVLPRGFQRIRHYGLLANVCRKDKLQLSRDLLAAAGTDGLDLIDPPGADKTEEPHNRCPKCHVGTVVVVEKLKPLRLTWPRGRPPRPLDSS